MTKFKPETADLTEEAFTSFVSGVLDGKIRVSFYITGDVRKPVFGISDLV